MRKSDDDDRDAMSRFNEALKRRDEGDYPGAIAMLRELAEKRPTDAAIVGMLAGLEVCVDDFANAVEHGRRAVQLSPSSELASTALFHALFGAEDIEGAFAELARFRRLTESAEYEQILSELESDTLRDTATQPEDQFLKQLLGLIRQEVAERPLRHGR